MRSSTSSHRRHHRPPPSKLEAIARVVDEGTDADPGHVLVHVVDEGDSFELGLRPLDSDTHPFVELAGFTAPPDWSMFGVRLRGTARHLDGSTPAERITSSYLLDRDGTEISILRTADGPKVINGTAEGLIPDSCRRVLGLATEPAPPTTDLLWTLAWLDRLVEVGLDGKRSLRTWAQLAVLHPAVRSAADTDLLNLDDPARLVTLGRAHAAAWPWARLRDEPAGLVLPGEHVRADVTRWMDDGFYARWALGAYPPLAELAHELPALLPERVRGPFLTTLSSLLAP